MKELLAICISAAVAGGTCASASVSAQDYPVRPIRIIVSVPPGGAIDTVARMTGQRMAESFKQPAIVENRPGGNSIIAAEAASRAPADGYTLFMALDITMTMN